MLAEIKIDQMRRCRMIRYNDLFLGSSSTGEVRPVWSDLYQNFHRNKFLITIKIRKVHEGGRPIEDITTEYTDAFSQMEAWCDSNCSGFWTVWDNEDELDDGLPSSELKIQFMFEYEEDLIRYIRDCAVITKLSLP
jgi:hypothetical protein